jgi:protein-serine/threonine kinase
MKNLENFNFLKILGEGSFGKVVLVKQDGGNKEFAMKVISKKENFSSVLKEKQVKINSIRF